MDCELKRPYPRVRMGEELSCGGSQNWFDDANFRACGCGVVACADTLLYLRGQGELTRGDYMLYVNQLRRRFPLIPGRGIDGVRLALGLNACFRAEGLALRASWSVSGGRFWDRLAEQLEEDLPAIIAIGPNFPKLWGREELTLYVRTPAGAYEPSARTNAHFLAATGLDGAWMRVSSWGRELWISREEYGRYMKRQGALFTNLLRVRKK